MKGSFVKQKIFQKHPIILLFPVGTSERTFQILTQVSGRAGREKDKGRVVIQTYNPDNFSIECSKKQDYKLFYQTEIMIRKQLKYPPFCDIILIGLTSTNLKEIEEESNKIYEYLKSNLNNEYFNVLIQMPAQIDKIQNIYKRI